MRTIGMLAVAVVASLTGCKQRDAPAKSGSAAPKAAESAGSGSGSSAAAAASAPAAFLPPKLEEKQGIVLAEAAGGTVEAAAKDGAVVELADGARVAVVEMTEIAGADQEARPGIVVTSGGKQLRLPRTAVMMEADLSRSPDGKSAVFGAASACDDGCIDRYYFVAVDGRRAELGDGYSGDIEWRRDGKEVYVAGASEVWLVSLPEVKVQSLEERYSPSYAPDGTLYVRDADGAAYKRVAGKLKRVYKPAKAWVSESDHHFAPPPPVEFDAAGKPKYKL